MKRIKKWFFKTCPKSGRIVGINKKNVMLKIFFPLLGLAALVWFLIRVVPKPTRIEYPCQQIAAPLAISFVAFFGSTLAGWGTWKKFVLLWKSRKFYAGLAFLSIGMCCTGLLYVMSVDNSLMGQVINVQIDNGTDMGTFVPVDKPNSPMGIARGIHPGRVAWAYDPLAAVWDGETGLYSDAKNNSQTRINDLLEGVVLSLTNQTTLSDAWNELFVVHNRKKGKGNTGYKKGEKIAVKINLNSNGGSNIIDATPQSVNALLHQLVDSLGVPQECITVYDAQRRGISAVYLYNEPLYPDVVYQNWGGFVPEVVHYSSEITDKNAMGLARAAYEADYMINMALLKRHSKPTNSWRDSAGQTGVTGTGKNQFGSIGNVPPLHLSIRDWSKFRGMGTYNSVVDLMSHERLGGNTLIFLVDALYPTPIHNGKGVRFQLPPFNGGWTSSFLASNDQVAIESVLLDFINSEMELPANADNFLHEAANIGNPPSKIAYAGKEEGSLGVHEHWNNDTARMYSRNLGTGDGIELYRVSMNKQRPAIEYFYVDRRYLSGNGTATVHWKTSNAGEVLLSGKKVPASGSSMISLEKSELLTLTAGQENGATVEQKLLIRYFGRCDDYEAKDALTDGSAIISPEGYAEFQGEKGSSKGSLSWNVSATETGQYYLIVVYSGGSPVPSYLYLNGELASENLGYLATTNTEPGSFLFPVNLKKGTNTVRIEHLGRRSNQIHKILLAKENN